MTGTGRRMLVSVAKERAQALLDPIVNSRPFCVWLTVGFSDASIVLGSKAPLPFDTKRPWKPRSCWIEPLQFYSYEILRIHRQS